MRGKCQLYLRDEELLNSHIIPKFVYDYTKSTGSPYLRAFSKPNVRLQDGPKRYLLCNEAEQEFSKRERWFANNIFFPYQKDEKYAFDYDENLGYFIISVLWRMLTQQIPHESIKKNPQLDFLSDVAEEWRIFLADGKVPSKYVDMNMMLTHRLAHNSPNIPKADYYFSRMIDATIVTDEDCSTVAVYVKFLRFTIWSVVKGSPTNGDGLKVNFGNGNLKAPQFFADNFMGGFFGHRIHEVNSLPKMNAQQEQKVIQEIMKSEGRFWDSDAGQAMLNDYRVSK